LTSTPSFPSPIRSERTVTGFHIAERSRVLTGPVVTVDDVVMVAPDGSRHDRQVVGHPGAVSVVALTADDRVIMIRQYRAALDAQLLEIPAGKRDLAGEDPAETARRELLEEVGRSAGSLVKLAEFHNSPGFSNEHSIVYLAQDLTEGATERQGVEELHLEVVEIPMVDIPAMIADGSIRDAKSIIGLLLARAHLDT
jgi:8-oxo-dGTP pyrophosphatase MutT (NUDIX family)